MGTITILTEADLRRTIGLDPDTVACVERAFAALSAGGVVMPPILRLDIAEHNGEVDVKTAYVPGLENFAIKVSPGFFNNPRLGLPSLNGLMILFSARTGLVEALMLDNGYLTAVRTAAAGAVAAGHLSREACRTAAILGAGEQARLQLQALLLVRPIDTAFCWSRRFDQAQRYAAEMRRRTGIDVQAAADPGVAVRRADIVVTCTAAGEPVLKADWLRPGQHITAMGSDAEHKNELEPGIFSRTARYAADSLAQTRRLGELHHALDAGLAETRERFVELGDVISGRAPGRTDPDMITVADLTGTGVQDTAIANLAGERARLSGAGFTIETE